MNAMEVQTHAQKLYAALGPKALAEAHSKAVSIAPTSKNAIAMVCVEASSKPN